MEQFLNIICAEPPRSYEAAPDAINIFILYHSFLIFSSIKSKKGDDINASYGKSLYAAQCRRMKFQKVSEFAKQIPTGFRNRAEVVLRNMRVAACGVLQLFAQNLAQRTARDYGNFEIFLNNQP